MKQFNNISYKEQELLVLLVEEAAETVVAVAKALRHGLNSMHPDNLPHVTGVWEDPPPDNRRDIAKEAGQFVGVLNHITELGILDDCIVAQAKDRKMRDAAKYLHHQDDPT